jgi:tetratricopeptide (TPR) repeat protein
MNTIATLVHNGRFVIAKGIRIAAVLGLLFGIYSLWTHSLPMLNGEFRSAAESYTGDRAVALYDAGLQQYQAEEFEGAVKVLTNAYNECLGPQGVVDDDKRKLAAEIKFLTGNALVKSEKLSKAVEAYKEALRLEPNHLYAKYNLELLQQMNGGKGPGDGGEPGGTKPGKGGKRGI